jgi:hypothetical protein
MHATLSFAASWPLVLSFLLHLAQAVVELVELLAVLATSEVVLHVPLSLHRRNWRSYLSEFDLALGQVGSCKMVELPRPSRLQWPLWANSRGCVASADEGAFLDRPVGVREEDPDLWNWLRY